MTAEIVNLRRARKARTRDARSAEADAARAKHGRSRAESEAQKRETDRAARVLDLHHRGDADRDLAWRDLPSGDD